MKVVDIKVPVLGESVSEATVANWLKKAGDFVQMDEVIVELETDKVTLEITSPTAGAIHEIVCAKNSIVHVGDVLGKINANAKDTGVATQPASTQPASVQSTNAQTTTQADPAKAAPAATPPKMAAAPVETPAITQAAIQPIQPAAQPTAQAASVQNPTASTAHLSPAVRKHLADNQLTASDIPTSIPGQALSKEDVINYVKQTQAQAAQTQAAAATQGIAINSSSAHTSTTASIASADRLETRIPMSRLRQRISERLKFAQNSAAMLTTFNEVDMSAVKQLRDKYKDIFEKKHGVKLGFMSFFVKACVQALKEIPMVNSRIEDNEIVTSNYCDIGVAVSAPAGLMVPVLRDAELLDLAGIEATIAGFGKKAKEGKITMEEMSGGTFTISNGGVFGSLLSTPIINPPQSAILGMHKIQDRPVAVNGRIEIRPMMYLALSYDHRLIDGREAVTFLATIKDCLENPGRFLLEI